MKKKNTDRQKASELLQKLQAAVLSSSQKREKKQQTPDQDEIEFQNKIAAMLQKATGEGSAEKKANDTAAAAPKPEKKSKPAEKSTKAKARSLAKEHTEPLPKAEPEPPVAAVPEQQEASLLQPESVPEPAEDAVPASIQALTPDGDEAKPKGTEPKKRNKQATQPSKEKKLPDALLRLTDTPEEVTTAAEEAPKAEAAPSPEAAVTEPLHEEAQQPKIAEATAADPSAEVLTPSRKKRQPTPRAKSAHLHSKAQRLQEQKPQEAASLPASEELPEELPEALQCEQPKPTERKAVVARASEAPVKKPIEATKKPIVSAPQAASTAPKEAGTAAASTQLRPSAPAQPPKKPEPIRIPPPNTQAKAAPSPAPTPRATMPAPERIVIIPKSVTPTPFMSEQKEIMQENKNRTTTPSASTKKEADAIVIQPTAAPQAAEPIVIRPRRSSRVQEPTKEEAPEANVTPIAVRPAQNTAEATQAKGTKPTVAPPRRKNPSAGVSMPHSSGTPFARNAAAEEAGEAPSMAQSDAKRSAPRTTLNKKPAERKPPEKKPSITLPHLQRRKPSHINRTPIATLPEDEHLNEALDEILQEDVIEVLPMDEPEVHSLPGQKGTVTSRRKEAKAKQQESLQNAIALIEKKTGMTEDDIAMIFDLGYENELGRLVGYETLKKLKFEHIRKRRRAEDGHYRTALGYRNAEYTGKQARDGIIAGYAYDKKRLLLRLVVTALIALVLVPLELPSLFEALLAPYSAAYPFLLPTLFPIAGMLLLLLAALISHRQLVAGLYSLFRFSPTPYSLNAVLVPLSFFCGILSFLIPGVIYVPANLSAVCSILVCIVCDVLRLSDELRVFHFVSAEGPKTVLDPAEPRKKKLRLGDKIVKIINDDVDQNLYRVHKSEQISGFFRRCNDFSAAARPFMILICAMIALSLLGGLFGAVYTDSLSGAISAFVAVLVMSTPTSALLLYFYPLCHANRLLSHRNCVLVGDESVEEYSLPKTVIFNDSDMYAAQKCTQISVRDGEDFRQDMRLAGILFRKMSGTLGSVGESAPLKNATEPPVAFVRLTENGTEAVVDGHHVLAGNGAFMAKSGVRVPKESTDRTLRRAANASLMYVAINGTLKLSYEIEYTVSNRFEEIVAQLAQTDTLAAIQTYDPNLNEAFLESGRASGAAYVRVIKPGRYEQQDSVQEVADSGAIALGQTTDIARPVLAAASISRLRRVGFRWLLATGILGALGTIPLILSQESLLPQMSLISALVYRALCTAIATIAARLVVRHACEPSDPLTEEQL